MKTLRSILMMSLLFVTVFACGQPPGGGGQRGGQQGPPPIPDEEQIEKMVGQISKDVSLSEEQETTILQLYTWHFQAVKEKTSGKSRPDREEMEKMKADLEEQVKAVLSEEQVEKYDAYLKKQNKGRGKRGPRKQ